MNRLVWINNYAKKPFLATVIGKKGDKVKVLPLKGKIVLYISVKNIKNY